MRGEGCEEAGVLHTLRIDPRASAALMEAKELRSDEDSELPVPAETGRSQHTCDTSSTGHQG